MRDTRPLTPRGSRLAFSCPNFPAKRDTVPKETLQLTFFNVIRTPGGSTAVSANAVEFYPKTKFRHRFARLNQQAVTPHGSHKSTSRLRGTAHLNEQTDMSFVALRIKREEVLAFISADFDPLGTQ